MDVEFVNALELNGQLRFSRLTTIGFDFFFLVWSDKCVENFTQSFIV